MEDVAEELRILATEVLVKAGSLTKCPVHEIEYTRNTGFGDELEGAYRLGNAMITRGEIHLPGYTSRAEFSTAIKETHNWAYNPDGCRGCSKSQDD